MKLVQFRDVKGEIRAAILRGEQVEPLTVPVLNLIRMAGKARVPLAALLAAQRRSTRAGTTALIPYEALEREGLLAAPVLPEEVWGAGVTYRPSADFRDTDMEAGAGIYDRAYRAERPELFFKATGARCVGPGQPIGLRCDATFTAPEPELAVVLGEDGGVVGYTLGNDVSAWSIERENPLYLPQSKIYTGCCALGPVLVTADEIRDPRTLELRCRILRDGACCFEGAAPVSQMKREIGELAAWLVRANQIPAGTVLLTGTGIIAPLTLTAGDVVEISCDAIGLLRNPCRVIGIAGT
jgi:2-dehydro-3-deoxy-D-arabinonate dehydratase